MKPFVVIIASFVLSSTAIAGEMSEALHNSMNAAGSHLFKFSYRKYSARWRTIAILQSCENKGIASQLDIPARDMADTLMDEMIRLNNSDDVKFSALSEAVDGAWVDLIQSVINQGSSYRLGFQHAISTLKESVPEICETGVSIANKILEEE